MMHIYILLAISYLIYLPFFDAVEPIRDTCQAYHATCDGSESAAETFNSHCIPISPDNSYALTDKGLEIYLHKPDGRVQSSNGVNDRLGNGATINSTFTLECVMRHFISETGSNIRSATAK